MDYRTLDMTFFPKLGFERHSLSYMYLILKLLQVLNYGKFRIGNYCDPVQQPGNYTIGYIFECLKIIELPQKPVSSMFIQGSYNFSQSKKMINTIHGFIDSSTVKSDRNSSPSLV